ncbi:MAG: antA/AntB antirepressor family protein [Clostridium sp.]|nr:antA/AntB antirepressor family protein [Clostridium sp.]
MVEKLVNVFWSEDLGLNCVDSRELWKTLKIRKEYADWIKDQLRRVEAKKGVDFITIISRSESPDGGRPKVTYIISLDITKQICIMMIVSNRLKKESKEIANKIRDYLIKITGEGTELILKSRKEDQFIDKLEEALKPFGIKGERQYHILGYRIDYYIASINLAIEYDENEHTYYSYEAQEGRQKTIQNKLNCKFIRVSDEKSDAYNIGYIIKNIFNLIG